MKHNLTVGTLLVTSWGYDQTNVDAYQVVAVGPSSIKVRAIETQAVPGSDTGAFANKVRVVKDKFLTRDAFGMNEGNAPTTLRLTKSGHFRIKGRYTLSVTDETKEHYTSWGH